MLKYVHSTSLEYVAHLKRVTYGAFTHLIGLVFFSSSKKSLQDTCLTFHNCVRSRRFKTALFRHAQTLKSHAVHINYRKCDMSFGKSVSVLD